MIRENRDAGFWNRVANHPDVRPHVGGEGALDLTATVASPFVEPLAFEHGGFVFAKHEIGRFELHTLVEPEGRGAQAVRAFREAIRWMFTRTDCVEIVTKTAASNRPAALMAKRMGFRPVFVRKAAWPDGTDVTFYSMTIEEWMQLDPTLEAEGHAFHEALEAAKQAAGSPMPTHPDDEAHDRAAGAASLMAKAGQAAKAAWIYSRWAALAGYQTIELIEDEPPVLDVRDALVTVRDGRMEVLECR